MKKYKNKKKSSRPIRGSLRPIEKTVFYDNFLALLHSVDVVDLDLLELFREQYKNVIAIYMRHASTVTGNRKYISIDTILANTNNFDPHEVGFIVCATSYYNEDKDIIKVDLSGSATGSKDCKKAFSQAKANSEIIFQRMIQKIIKKMKDGVWENITQEHIKQYESISKAVAFLVKYIPSLYIKKLPSQLSVENYKAAEEKDASIEEHYRFDYESNKYKLKSKCRHDFSSLTQECATFIFCCSFNNVI